jgi:hypothetical protein
MPTNRLCDASHASTSAATLDVAAPPDLAAAGPSQPTAAPVAPKTGRASAAASDAAPPEGGSEQHSSSLARIYGAKPPAAAAAASQPAAASVAGYASPAPKRTTASSSTGEWAFLSDSRLSIEEKLFRFMKKVMQKSDAEIEKKLTEYKARFTAATTSSSASKSSSSSSGPSKSSSPLSLLKSIVPGLDAVERALGGGSLEKLASSLGGPLLAGLATAFGAPALAPLALSVGGDVAAYAVKEVVGSPAKASSSSSGGSAEPGSPDEKMAMFELQRLVEKQQQMFAALSNTMKAMHDMQMGVIQNLR